VETDERKRCGRGDWPALSMRLSQVPTKSGRSRAANRYPGRCRACGQVVPAGHGCVEKSNGKWVIFC